jgi:two-component system chemotaxis response regulator CheY
MELNLQNLNILVVEDNVRTAKLIQAVLKDLRVGQVFSASNGREAQTFLDGASDLINLIVCDWNMPEMSGLELLKLVRAAFPEMPFLMVTARGTVDSVMAAKKNGVSAYIVKPFSPAELEQKVVALARKVPSDA